jgi:hypothetical protein
MLRLLLHWDIFEQWVTFHSRTCSGPPPLVCGSGSSPPSRWFHTCTLTQLINHPAMYQDAQAAFAWPRGLARE